MFIKIGENIEISRVESSDSCIPAVSQDILDQFKKTANSIKKIAPKAEDFLYFSAVMMHAAEASALNEDGTPKLNAKGEIVSVGWDKSNNTWKWHSNDPSIRPYKNSNGDIFPEEELVKAYKKWVHKPLCIDHKSSSVDHVRGFIVDTYYDRNLKRVIALCALDKHNYPDLARKVATGYSSSVSMGTAVGRAICSDCARVARAEPDFCDHMKRKTCYGEINLDLSPIELSIVVNGADPKAHIKHIIAAANTLNTYVDNKSKELNKLADKMFSANINFSDVDRDNNAAPGVASNIDSETTNFSIQSNDINKFKAELAQILKRLNSIVNSAEDLKSTENSEDEEVLEETDELDSIEDELNSSDGQSLAPPHARFASNNSADDIAELYSLASVIESKLNSMKDSLDKLSINFTNKKEENMSRDMNKRAYFQGGGGVNEPTPGQVKYPKDGLNEDLRTSSDKQMVGQMDTGPVDGMHPGTESSGMSELERKKMLARAEAEERALRRTAIVNLARQALEDKKAYFQGGGGVNEPTPGKVKYPADRLQEDLREDGDKQMVGQKPFPGVGDVEGLHPSPASSGTQDELKRKQMLSRAGLRARFVKAANNDGSHNLGRSTWEVFLGDKLLVTASVNELTGGNSAMLYDTIATKEFGSKLIEKVKVFGADGIRTLVKRAQDAGAPPPPPPPAGGDAAAMPPPPPPPPAGGDVGLEDLGKEEEGAVDAGKSGDVKQTAIDLSEKVRDLSSDLVEAVRALTEEKKEMDTEEAKEGEAEGEEKPLAASASFTTNTLNSLRKELNRELTQAMKEAYAELRDHNEELEMISDVYNSGGINRKNASFVNSVVGEAFQDTKVAIADCYKLMNAFVKYARGTKAVIKRAQMEAELNALDEMRLDNEEGDMSGLDGLLDGLMANDNIDSDFSSDMHDLDYDNASSDTDDADDNYAVVMPDASKAADFAKANPGVDVKVASRRDRAALRAKLAADALGDMDDGEVQDMSKATFSDMLDESNGLTDGQTRLNVKPSDNLGRVETLAERNKAMMDVATAEPRVRREAEAIHKLVSEGKLDRGDLNALVAEGLDKDAVAYYKKYYGAVEGGSEFASELVKEHVKAQLEDELGGYRVKMARAYELANEMVARGLCLNETSAISAQVDEIMKFNDESFDSLKRVVARHAPMMQKEAGRMPQVGIIGSGEVNTAASDDWAQLSAAFAKSSKRMF